MYNARRNVEQNGKSLESEFDLSAAQSDANTRNADGTLIPRDRGLARFSALYQQIETLDKLAIKVSVTRRVKLAAMAQYRNSLVQDCRLRNQPKMPISTSFAPYIPSMPRLGNRTRRRSLRRISIGKGCAIG